MDSFFAKIGLALVATILVGVAAFFTGTMVWLLWPWAIPAAFPGLVASGVITGKISWGASVCPCWLSGLLLKSSVTVNS